MPSIALIGAGSAVFSKNVIADVLWHDSLKDCELRLMDIDRERLDTARMLAESVNAAMGAGARIVATPDRRRALDGADFVVCTIGVGGFAATKDDLLIPLRFGVKQTVGDTLGVGGVFRAARSVPVLLSICEDMAQLCPDALLLNYSNPMAMHCLAVERATRIRHVGLCHGVQNTAGIMRMYVAMMKQGVSPAAIKRHFTRPYTDPVRYREWCDWVDMGKDPELSYTCAGINHLAFFLRFESAGRDLYPALRRILDTPYYDPFDPVRFELFRRLGYFMTETSGHIAEYVPWFLRSEEEIKRLRIPVVSYVGTCRSLDKAYRALRRTVKSGKPVIGLPYQPSVEHASRILNAIVTGKPYLFNGNVHNAGGALIANLPGDCCVEVPCVADSAGIRPIHVGELPPQCAALIRTNVNVQDLAVRGILEGRRDLIRQAVMVDPNTASQIPPRTIWRLCDAMFRAHAGRLPRGMK